MVQHSCTGSQCPCEEMVVQPVEVVSFFRNSLPLVAEQVIEVPKLTDTCCVWFLLNRRWRSSWWTCLPSTALLSRPSTFLVHLVMEVLKVFSQGKVLLQLSSRSSFFQFRVVAVLEEVFNFPKVEVLRSVLWRASTLQFQVVVLLEFSKVFTQDRARCSELWN